MGKYKFRLSDMIPKAWFYKLRDMGKGRDNTNTTTTTTNNHNNNNNTNSPKKKQIKPSTKTPTTTTTTLQSKQKHLPHNTSPRKSYYFTRELLPNDHNTLLNLPDPPRRSSRQKGRRRTSSRSSPRLVASSVSAGCSCRATLWANNTKSLDISPPDANTYPPSTPEEGSASLEEAEPYEPGVFPPEFRSDRVLTTRSVDQMMSLSTSACPCKLEATDIVIDVDKKSLVEKPENDLNRFDNISELDLAPIITKQVNVTNHEEMKKQKKNNSKQRIKSSVSKIAKEDLSPGGKRHYQNSASSPGIRLRVNSPRIGSRRTPIFQGRRSISSLSGSSCTTTTTSTTTTTTSCSSSTRRRRINLSASLAIVKSSMDPQRDFEESMVEMIVENNIRGSKDLEDLLACYLSLNSDEYHALIIKVFKQIWFDLGFVKFK